MDAVSAPMVVSLATRANSACRERFRSSAGGHARLELLICYTQLANYIAPSAVCHFKWSYDLRKKFVGSNQAFLKAPYFRFN